MLLIGFMMSKYEFKIRSYSILKNGFDFILDFNGFVEFSTVKYKG